MTLYTRLKLFSRQVFIILASVLSSIRQTKATEARSKALAHTQLIEPTELFHLGDCKEIFDKHEYCGYLAQ